MQQLKYLNFHKLLANFASNLTGAFVSIIIYSYTNSIVYAFIYLFYENLCRWLFGFCFKKQCFNKPQLMLLYRIISMLGYNIFIILIDSQLILAVLLIGLFKGVDNSLCSLPNEIIYNYSSLNKGSETLGFTRLVEKLGIVLASLAGGFLLDVDKTIVVLVSISIYSISLVPLLIFYFKSRNSAIFNKDAISNAIENLYKKSEEKVKTRKLIKEFLVRYGVVYALFSLADITMNAFKIHVFVGGGKFASVGIYTAILEAAFGIGSMVYAWIDAKRSTTKLVSIASVVIGVCNILLYILKLPVLLGVIYFFLGMAMPVQSLYMLQRYLAKSRILGVSNEALFCREISCTLGYEFLYGVGVFGGLLSIFILISAGAFVCAWAIPYNEEKTRNILVDILQENEIRESNQRRQRSINQILKKGLNDIKEKNEDKNDDLEEIELPKFNLEKGEEECFKSTEKPSVKKGESKQSQSGSKKENKQAKVASEEKGKLAKTASNNRSKKSKTDAGNNKLNK